MHSFFSQNSMSWIALCTFKPKEPDKVVPVIYLLLAFFTHTVALFFYCRSVCFYWRYNGHWNFTKDQILCWIANYEPFK